MSIKKVNCVVAMQNCLDIGLNAFAARLLIESYETMPNNIKEKIGNEITIIMGKTNLTLKTIKESESENDLSTTETQG